jgi:hypothetical protein
MKANYAINADSEKRRAFVASLFTAGYGERLLSRFGMPTLSYRQMAAHGLSGPSKLPWFCYRAAPGRVTAIVVAATF